MILNMIMINRIVLEQHHCAIIILFNMVCLMSPSTVANKSKFKLVLLALRIQRWNFLYNFISSNMFPSCDFFFSSISLYTCAIKFINPSLRDSFCCVLFKENTGSGRGTPPPLSVSIKHLTRCLWWGYQLNHGDLWMYCICIDSVNSK